MNTESSLTRLLNRQLPMSVDSYHGGLHPLLHKLLHPRSDVIFAVHQHLKTTREVWVQLPISCSHYTVATATSVVSLNQTLTLTELAHLHKSLSSSPWHSILEDNNAYNRYTEKPRQVVGLYVRRLSVLREGGTNCWETETLRKHGFITRIWWLLACIINIFSWHN